MLEAVGVGIHDVERHLHAVPFEGHFEHREMIGGIHVAREAHETHLALGDHLLNGPHSALFRIENPPGVSVILNRMELQQVNPVGFQPAEALLHLFAYSFIIPGTDLGHQYDLVPPGIGTQSRTHVFLICAIVILPGIIEESDPMIHRLMHQTGCLGERLVVIIAMPSSEADD